ncbi:MAG: GAF domain-containing protein [Desulfobacterales bacterium]|nr:GAF domain-containing protein [Desulfobacterales bacterium]
MQEDQIKDETNLGLLKMISTHNIEDQCSYIENWFKQHYALDGIGFFLKEPEFTRTHFFTKSVPMNVVQNLQEMLISINQTKEAESDVLLFTQKDWEFITFSHRKDPGSLEPMGIAIPLGVPGGFVGTLTLLADSETIHNFTTEMPSRLSFVPLISMLLNNAYSHEMKDNKIRMLNLYQNVSSSLGYIGDLQELLATITAIVTSELLCEECSVLLYDQESNEFEFFTAFGETGMKLISERFPADKGIAGRALRERKTQVVNDVQRDPDFFRSFDEEHAFTTKSILAAPLIAGDELVGILNAINKIETKFFDKEDDQIISAIADEVALAVKNARLFDYVVESYCKIKQGLNSCKGCRRPLKSWTPCVRQLELL